MNIFALDKDPVKATEYMIDVHVGSKSAGGKMIVESSQLLANAYTLDELLDAPFTQKNQPRKHSYIHHPSSKWVIASLDNFNWLLLHAQAMIKEKLYRGGNLHSCYEFLDWCSQNTPNLPSVGLTPFALAMPEEYKQNDPIQAYRDYYMGDKQYNTSGKWMMIYTNRDYPKWFNNSLISKCKKQNEFKQT